MSNLDDVIRGHNPIKEFQSAREIAAHVGVTRQTIYNIMKNPERTSITRLRAVLDALGYTLELHITPKENGAQN